MARNSSLVKRIVALTLAGALIVAAPGIGAYRAAAQQIVPVEVGAPAVGTPVAGVAVSAPLGSDLRLGGSAEGVTLGSTLGGSGPSPTPRDAVRSAVTVDAGTSGSLSAGTPVPQGREALSRGESAARPPVGVVEVVAPSPVERDAGVPSLDGAVAAPKLAVKTDGFAVVRGRKSAIGGMFRTLIDAFSPARNADAVPAADGSLAPARGAGAPTAASGQPSSDAVSEGVTTPAQVRLSAPTRGPTADRDRAPTTASGQPSSDAVSEGAESVKPGIIPAIKSFFSSSGKGGGNGSGGDNRGPSLGGLGRTAIMFIVGLVVAQIGVEALGAAMPTLVQRQFGDFTAVAQMAIFSSITSIIGRQVASLLTKRFGLKKTYLGAEALRLVAISVLATLLATGTMTLPLMMVFYSFNGFLGGIAVTAEASIPPALLDPKLPDAQKQAALERFWTWENTILETIGVSGPIATGAVVVAFGFLPALIAYPVTFGIAILVFLKYLRIPDDNDPRAIEMRRLQRLRDGEGGGQQVPEPRRSLRERIASGWAASSRSLAVLRADAVLKWPALFFTIVSWVAPLAFVAGPVWLGVNAAVGLAWSAGALLRLRNSAATEVAPTTASGQPSSDAVSEGESGLRRAGLRHFIVGFAGLAALAAFVAVGGLSVAAALGLSAVFTSAVSLAAMRTAYRLDPALPVERRARLSAGTLGQLKGVFKDFFRKIVHGAKLVWGRPVLRYAFLSFMMYTLLNPLLYGMIAPAYSLRLVAMQHPGLTNEALSQLATGIGGWMTGLYSLGGLLGGVWMMWEQKRIQRGRDDGTIDDEAQARILRSSVLRWMVLGTFGLAALALLAFALPTFGAIFALPAWLSWTANLTWPALALIPFGIAQVIATLKLRSLFQSKVPHGEMPDAMGFLGSASLVVVTVSLLGLKYLFKGLAGFAPFTYIAFGLIPLGLLYLYLMTKVRSSTSQR